MERCVTGVVTSVCCFLVVFDYFSRGEPKSHAKLCSDLLGAAAVGGGEGKGEGGPRLCICDVLFVNLTVHCIVVLRCYL